MTSYTIHKWVDPFDKSHFVLDFFLDDHLIGGALLVCDVNVSLEFTYITSEYQGKGYGKKLYRAIAESYRSDPSLNGKIIIHHFTNPKAYYIAKTLLPSESWNERHNVYAFL